jgi:4-hydroxybenzoate polyprenyltransferase
LNGWPEGTLPWLGIAVAGGAGLLIGLERERRKRQPGHVAFAGVRTFTLAALAGALAQALGEPWMVVAGAVLLGALITVAYAHRRSTTVLRPSSRCSSPT